MFPVFFCCSYKELYHELRGNRIFAPISDCFFRINPPQGRTVGPRGMYVLKTPSACPSRTVEFIGPQASSSCRVCPFPQSFAIIPNMNLVPIFQQMKVVTHCFAIIRLLVVSNVSFLLCLLAIDTKSLVNCLSFAKLLRHDKSSALIKLIQNPKPYKAFHKTEDSKAQGFFLTPFISSKRGWKKDSRTEG